MSSIASKIPAPRGEQSQEIQTVRPAPAAPQVVVAQACWHGPSDTIVRGLLAAGVSAKAAVEGEAGYAEQGFVHPGTMRVRGPNGAPVIVAPQTLPKLGIHGRPVPSAAPADKAAAAVMHDSPWALANPWQELDAPERTAVLCCAAAVGAEHVARFCIGKMVGQLDTPDGGCAGNTPLHYAALACQAGVATLLLKAGACPSPLNPVNTEPMHDAARSGSIEVLRSLHEAGVDLTRANTYGDTLLHRVAEFTQTDESARFLAVYHFCVAQYASKSSNVAAYVNRINNKGFNALDMATVRGQTSLIAALVQDGATHSKLWSVLPADQRTYENLNHRAEWEEIRDTLEQPQAAAA